MPISYIWQLRYLASFASSRKLSYSTKFGYHFLRNKERKDRIQKIQPIIFKTHILNPEKVHFQIMNHVVILVVAWHSVLHVCMDKCIRRWTSTNAEIKNYLKNFFISMISLLSVWLKRYPQSDTSTVYISKNIKGSIQIKHSKHGTRIAYLITNFEPYLSRFFRNELTVVLL